MKSELTVHKRQKQMIAQLKIDLAQSKERILSLEQRLQSECNSKVVNYVDQLEKLKKQYDEKVINTIMNLYLYKTNLYHILLIFRLMS